MEGHQGAWKVRAHDAHREAETIGIVQLREVLNGWPQQKLKGGFTSKMCTVKGQDATDKLEHWKSCFVGKESLQLGNGADYLLELQNLHLQKFSKPSCTRT